MTIERQMGTVWQVAASYMGSHTDRLWNQMAINPGVFLGRSLHARRRVLHGLHDERNLNQRREFSLSGENPAAARLIGMLDLHTNIGTQDYRGLKLSFQRRGDASGLSGNYTVSRCYGDPALQTGNFPEIANGYTNPKDPEFDIGYCDQDRTHIGAQNRPPYLSRTEKKRLA